MDSRSERLGIPIVEVELPPPLGYLWGLGRKIFGLWALRVAPADAVNHSVFTSLTELLRGEVRRAMVPPQG